MIGKQTLEELNALITRDPPPECKHGIAGLKGSRGANRR